MMIIIIIIIIIKTLIERISSANTAQSASHHTKITVSVNN